MEELNVEGLFWLAGQAGANVAGRLTFDFTNGAHLDLLGSLNELDGLFDESERPVRIHGVAGGRKLTLVDCARTGESIQIPGIAREQYRPSLVLSGCHIDESQPMVFDGMRLVLQHLNNWIRKTGTVVDHQVGPGQIQITHNPLQKESIPIEDGDLQLSFTQRFNPDPFHTTTLTQNAVLGVQFKEPQTLQRIFQTRTALRNLVTIGVGAPAFVNEAYLERSDFAHDVPGGNGTPIPIGLYSRGLEGDIRGDVKTIHPMNMLFTFDDIGGLDGIANWINISARFKPVIDSLLSHWYLPKMYTDNRFLNIVIAAEALERIRLNRQKFNFKQGLQRLTEFAGDPFQSMVKDVETWVNEIVRVRTNNLVHRGLRGDIEDSRMYWLSESLYFLVVFCMLRECGVPENTLTNIKFHRSYRGVEVRLQQAN